MSKGWSDLEDVKQADYTEYKNLLLIDGNNIAYRYIRRANYNNYAEDFRRTVQSLGKSYKASRIIVCFDFGKSYYRGSLLGDYKGTRAKPDDGKAELLRKLVDARGEEADAIQEKLNKIEEEVAHAAAFFSVLNSLPDELDEEVLKFRGVEADDLIAWLRFNLHDEHEHTWIVSSDKDLLQLIDEDVSVFNLFSRKEIDLAAIEELGLTPEEYRLSRIIEGDKSDNIIGIAGIGPKRAQDLAKSYKTFDNLIAALPIAGKAQFIQNLNAGKQKLIDNEKLINLRDYHEVAIAAGKSDIDILDYLAHI